MTKIKIVCSKCGGDTILRDAYAYWDVEAQEWALSSVYDAFLCSSCGHDACDEVPADDDNEAFSPEQTAREYGWLPDPSSTTPGAVYKRDHGETFTASSWAEACGLECIR
ncbi:hypothetical protein KL86PLE_90711 [uncultured Pleomorphomonas sp.]|uniref:Uncharacterized protein n=1 Tax=uncultured Pleomorphomonas sp. TaxID=442121 RepID=A0A212LQQ1_9HYPH|nr:hypothetical protein [uncultured Pleomorphomonas sp.]SCM79925.1 hypothetical protein KL86PLE_90711 [uncultured Pleomorphomonas sp.]